MAPRKAKSASLPVSPFQEAKAASTAIVGNVDGNDILISTDDPSSLGLDPIQGTIELAADNDDVIVDLNPQEEEGPQSDKFDDNLAEYISSGILGGISTSLLDAIDEDERDRADWLNQRAQGIDLLGLKLERPGGSVSTSTSSPMDGMSRVRDPILLDAVLRAQANAYAEMCPSEGPCKVVNYGDETTDADKLSEDMQKDFNFFFTNIAEEYYPDTRKMLGMTVFASGMFKKVYWHPLLKRPISESVDGSDLIVPSSSISLRSGIRVTHQIDMDQRVMKIMQSMGVYRDIPLRIPTPEPNVLQRKTADVAGMALRSQRPDDQNYTVLECYCSLDLEGFEHKKGGKETGIPLPYRVTLDKDSREILEIRRNYREDDPGLEDGNVQAKIPFVAYPYVTAGFAGFYGIGLLQILGNVTMSLTAMLRESIDAGMFANFPGGLITRGASRQMTNEIRVAPGTLAQVDIGAATRIQDAIMHLPYNDVTQGILALMQMLVERGSRLGGAAEVPVGEGVQNAPVGTILAMIEQATQVMSGVHKSMHAAQAEEFRLFKELFRDDPESLWRGNKRPALGPDYQQRLARFKQALENCEIVPASDPNVPSHMHRVAKVQTMIQLTQNDPGIDQMAVKKRAAAMLKIDDFDAFVLPPQQDGPNPDMMIELGKLQVAQQKNQNDQLKIAVQAQNEEANRKSKETVEALKLATTIGVHPEANQIVDEQLMQMMPLIHPSPRGTTGGLPMAEGGRVEGEERPLSDQEVRDMMLAVEIAKFVQSQERPEGPLQ